MTSPPSTYRVLTGPQPAGIAVIELRGPAIPTFLAAHLVPPPNPASTLSHHHLVDHTSQTIDDPVLSRFSNLHAEISLHAGPEIVRQAEHLIASAGFVKDTAPPDLPTHLARLLPHCRTELATRTLLAQLHNNHLPLTQSPALAHLLFPPTVAIIGLPNVGKSTLLNRLAGHDAAITADLPGTTRDYVSIEADLNGLVVRLLDTPGLRDTPDPIEAAAIANAHPAILLAHAQVIVLDATRPLLPEEHALLSRFPSAIVVANKSDLAAPPVTSHALPLSATTGTGMERLISALLARFDITTDLPSRRLPLPA